MASFKVVLGAFVLLCAITASFTRVFAYYTPESVSPCWDCLFRTDTPVVGDSSLTPKIWARLNDSSGASDEHCVMKWNETSSMYAPLGDYAAHNCSLAITCGLHVDCLAECAAQNITLPTDGRLMLGPANVTANATTINMAAKCSSGGYHIGSSSTINNECLAAGTAMSPAMEEALVTKVCKNCTSNVCATCATKDSSACLSCYAPLMANSTGHCVAGACAAHCTTCATNGSGKCDATGCHTGYIFNSTSMTCHNCTEMLPNCETCNTNFDPPLCTQCKPGWYPFDVDEYHRTECWTEGATNPNNTCTEIGQCFPCTEGCEECKVFFSPYWFHEQVVFPDCSKCDSKYKIKLTSYRRQPDIFNRTVDAPEDIHRKICLPTESKAASSFTSLIIPFLGTVALLLVGHAMMG
eukprot:GHVT01073912.1.p1 GENE.GHVT01073912.1~~GHVT01073912.1.p1  ORF type:complete len:410 (-),score=14.76 GHVT01073912.1:442-1671(-)